MAEPGAVRQSPFRSVAFRFALIFACVFALAAALILGMVWYQIGRYSNEAMAGSLQTETATLLAEDRRGLATGIARRMAAVPNGTYQYLLLDPSGRRLVGSIPIAAARSGWGQVIMREHAPTPTDPEYPERLMTLGTRLPDGSLLVVATDGFDVDKLSGDMIAFTIVWAIAITLVALVGGWMAGRIFLSRLAATNAAIEGIMAGRTDQRFPMIGLAPELDDLARNLNRMLDRIDGLIEGLRQVSTDIAHDLRTPLTRLRQMLEAAQEAADRGEAQADIEAALVQTDQVLATFRAIMRLAQIEGGGRQTPFVGVDMGALLAPLIDMYEPVAVDADHILAADVAQGCMVLGDPELLTQLFANLLENALLHTPAGTCVTIGMKCADGKVIVSVADNGPGVPRAERDRITRRFYQVDPSRSSGGAGLGLSIVDAIAALHRAHLVIGDAAPGLCVSVALDELTTGSTEPERQARCRPQDGSGYPAE